MNIGLKRFFGKLFIILRFFKIFRFLQRHKLTILAFHNPNLIEFENQIKFIKKYYKPVTLEDVYNYYYTSKDLPTYPILITFDDGYKNIKTFVEPILVEYGIKAVIFVPTELINHNKISWWDIVEYALVNTTKKSLNIYGTEYQLNKEKSNYLIKVFYHILTNCDEEEKEKIIDSILKKTRVSIPRNIPEKYQFLKWFEILNSKLDYGSHTVSHPILTNLNKEVIQKELIESKKQLETKLKKKIYSFCYPNGDYNKIVLKEVEMAGYKLAFSTIFGNCNKNTNPLLLKRVGVNKLDDAGVMAMKICSLITPLYMLREQNKKIKVIHSTNYYYPQLGGLTISIDKLNSELLEKNIDSSIYAFPYGFRIIENFFKSSLIRKKVHKIFVVVYICIGLIIVLINRLKLRKVLVHGHSANFCAIFAYLSTFLGAKSLFTFHTDIRLLERERLGNARKRQRFFLSRINKLSSVSNFLKKQVKHYYKLKTTIKVIYNGVPISHEYKFNKIKKIPDSILFVGNLTKIKDPLTFIESIAILKKQGLKLMVNIIGTGDMHDEIRQKIHTLDLNHDVELLGRVERDKIAHYYSLSSVYVLSSIGEGFPNTILEAISFECRIVATSVGGITEIGIKKNGWGTLVPPNRADLMAKAIKHELNKKAYKNNPKLYKKFNWDLASRHYIHLYKDLYNKHIKEEFYVDLIK